MEIHNTLKESSLKKSLNKLGVKKIITIFLLIFSLAVFGFFCVIYGAYLNKTSQTSVLKMFLTRISELNFSFIPNYIKSTSADIDKLSIDIKFKNWEKIRYLREKALINGRITDDIQERIPAKIIYNNHSYKVDLNLTGMTNEHIRHPEKWSLSVKVKGGKTIFGMRKFALLIPQSRGYLTDWIAMKLLVDQDIIGLRSDFVDVTINGKYHGIYYLEERFDKRLIENNSKKEGIIFKADDYGSGIEVYGLKKIKENKELSSQFIILKQLWYGFLNGDIEVASLFDVKKFASFYVVSDIMNQKHALFFMNMRLYFNPVTNLIEPIGREWGYLREENDTQTSLSIEQPESNSHVALSKNKLLSRIYNSFVFEEAYIKQANILSEPPYLEEIVKNNKEKIKLLLNKIHKQNPFYKFPLTLLQKNSNYIREKLFPNFPLLKIYFNTIKDGRISLYVENRINLPIEIHSFSYDENIIIIPDQRILLESKFKSLERYKELNISLNKINTSQFSPDSLEVSYSILGLDHIKKTIVFPKKMTKKDFSKLNPTRQNPNFKEFKFLTIDEKGKLIRFSGKICEVNKDLVIPEGYSVLAEPGCIIDLKNSSRIISYSPILFFGKIDNFITITSSDLTGQGIVVFNCKQTSELSYVNFIDLRNVSDSSWNLTGAITFYESPIVINNCIFENNLSGDDYLNIIRTTLDIRNTTFKNIKADALDADFCKGKLNKVDFIQIGNDAVDVSGSQLKLTDILIVNPGDKGISAGEGSHLICNNIIIKGGEIAIASKDDSKIEINRIKINGTKIGFCAYQKKSEFGRGTIIVNNLESSGVEIEFLVEIGSTLIINGKTVDKKSSKVKEILYGNEFGRSSK